MKKIRDILSRPAVTAALFILAAALLFGGTVSGARAALSRKSETFVTKLSMENIGVTLLENGDPVIDETLLSDFLSQTGDELIPGYVYDETLAVENTGAVDQYVRATVYKYWMKLDAESGEYVKAYDMNSEWIELHFVTGNGWEYDADTTSKTEERTVLYYDKALAHGDVTPEFMDTIKVTHDVVYHVTQEQETVGGVTTITTTFDYDGSLLCLKVVVDAVQTNNAEDAIKSAWGKDAAALGITLS